MSTYEDRVWQAIEKERAENRKKLSARALGVLVQCAADPNGITVRQLSAIFREGKDAIATALKELRDAKLVLTSTQKISGTFVTVTRITKAGYGTLENRIQIPLSMQNSNKSLIPIHTESITNTTPTESGLNIQAPKSEVDKPFTISSQAVERGGYTMEEVEAREAVEAARKHSAALNRIAASERSAEMRRRKRARKPQSKWTPEQSAYEFADKVQERLGGRHYLVNRTSLTLTISIQRAYHGSDGEQEMLVADMLFDRLIAEGGNYSEDDVVRRYEDDFLNLLTLLRAEDSQRQEVDSGSAEISPKSAG